MQPTETINVTMPPDMARALRESVEAGEYSSPSEAIRDALRLWQQEREQQAARLSAIRQRLRESADDPRPSVSLDEARARIARLHERTVRARSGESA